MLEIIFWSSLVFIVYAYAIYPLLLGVVSFVRRRGVDRAHITPPVSFIIAAHNEGARIAHKLENTLDQDYPADRLEIIVASDCSTDRTEEIARGYVDRGVIVVRNQGPRGKEHAQRNAIEMASGQILVFSDAGARLPLNAISRIVTNFHDPTVGCVSSVDHTVDGDGQGTGESGYVKYEMLLRGLESRVGSVVGLSGSFFAARREVCREWASDLPSDMHTLLRAVRAGLRGISDPGSIAYYDNVADPGREYDRKVRTVVRGISLLAASLPMLNPLRYGLFAWQLASHKLCRWLVPFAMVVAILSSGLLAVGSASYGALFVAQLLFYSIAVLGMRVESFSQIRLIRLLSFFLLSNLAIGSAWLRFIRGERVVSWEPSSR